MTRNDIIKLALDAGGRMYASDEVEFFLPDLEKFAALVAALAEPVQEPVAWLFTNLQSGDYDFCYQEDEHDHDREMWHKQPLYTAPPQQALTIERLRDALVASRIIPPAAVEDPDEYDDGITLFRIEALHRRIT